MQERYLKMEKELNFKCCMSPELITTNQLIIEYLKENCAQTQSRYKLNNDQSALNTTQNI